MKVKKSISCALCAAMAANLLVPTISASAYSPEVGSRVYTYSGYTVEYKIVSEWTGNQNIEITVTNTGDEILTDWAMGYNAGGEINGLWNAQVYAVQGTEYILKGASYNSEIEPNESVRFGYILSGEEFKYPQNIFNCAKRIDITDNYDVYYNIVGDYGDTYQAEMIIENLSEDDYSSWQLSFEGNATIDNLWNAKLLENNNGSFKVKNAEHNSVIYAGDSVSFNFGGTKLVEDNADTEETADISTAEVTEEIQPDVTDEAESNESETAETSDVATAEVTEEVQPDVTDEAESIESETAETVDVPTVEVTEEVQPDITDEAESGESETAETVDVPTVEVTEEVQPDITDEAESDESETAETANTQTEEATNETQSDEASPETEETADETTDTTNETAEAQTAEVEAYSLEYSPMNASVEANSDVVFGNYKLTAVVIPVEFDFEFDLELDSDGDGLTDYIETGLELDKSNPDTDGDGLPDGYEYYYLGTDPAKADSDDNGVSDADEDFDEDGLTNIEEYELSTNPFVADTDRDGLSDYDEVYSYNTDPTTPDTDGDKVTDGDEIILGLDPNDPETNGYPDSEYTTTQTVGEDSGALDHINDLEENPYTISVEVTAAGVADNCLSADESGYSNVILQNDAVLGVVPELTYSEGLSVTDVVINFHLDDSAVENELGVYDDPAFKGINRFNVFKYFEDNNVLLPIETFYDEETNTVYTHVDVMGSYCLIDMEKWLYNLENTPAGNYYEESDNEPANIVFCLDTRDIIDSDSFDDIKANIKAITDDAFGRYDDIKVYVYYQRFGSNFKVTNNLLRDPETGENYFTCYEDAEAALDKLERYLIKSSFWAYDYVEATQFMIDTCDENIIAMYHITADDRVMGSVSGAKKLLQTVQNSKYTTRDEEEINRIYVSLLCPNSDKVIDPDSYVAQLVEASGGIIYTAAEEMEIQPVLFAASAQRRARPSNPSARPPRPTTMVKDHLTTVLGDGDTCKYNVLISTGLTPIKLDKKLSKGSATDTDHDGLSDWDEVDWERINAVLKGNEKEALDKNTILSADLPTFDECMSYYDDIYYVANAAYGHNSWAISKVSDYPMLIITSNPADPDSDGDFMLDCIDNDLDKTNYWDIKDENPLYAYADTSRNYGINGAGILVNKTTKKPDEYVVKKTVSLPFYLYQTPNILDTDGHFKDKLTGPCKNYVPFPFELQEYMQSCCDTVINAYRNSQSIDEWRLELLEKYLTPELIMAIGVTESCWDYGGIFDIGFSNNYVGITGEGAKYIHRMKGADNASTNNYDYINIYCSISGAACIIAYDIANAGNKNISIGDKQYQAGDDQQLLYDALYLYGFGSQFDYYHSEARISSAYKLYAFQEFCMIRGKEWANWDKQIISTYCDNVTAFTWKYNEPTVSSVFVLPEDSRSKPIETGEYS